MRMFVALFALLVTFLVFCTSLGSSLLSLDEIVKSATLLRGGSTTAAKEETTTKEQTEAKKNSNVQENKNHDEKQATPTLEERKVVSLKQVASTCGLARNASVETMATATSTSTLDEFEFIHQNEVDLLDTQDTHLLTDEQEEDTLCFSAWSKMGKTLRKNKLFESFSKSDDTPREFNQKKKHNPGSVKKRQFFDRMAMVSHQLLETEHDAIIDSSGDDSITAQSDLTRPGRHISVVTTAALPWMTGTAVNPLLRAAYLTRTTRDINRQNSTTTQPQQWVTLVVPWLELREDRLELYGPNHVFDTPQEQEEYIRNWLRVEADMADVAHAENGLQIMFYPARYHLGLKSIFAMGDVCSLIPTKDVCILEEPEHLNWYRAPGTGWTKKFNYVVGIVHTNYREYASSHYSGLWTAPAIAALSSAMVRAYCHKVIKLSDVLQTFAPEKEETSNVHGVRSDFLKEGQRRALESSSTIHNVVLKETWDQEEEKKTDDLEETPTRVYFIGKILWAKGLDLLLEMQNYYRQYTGDYFAIDIYGSGPELQEITRAYHGRKVHHGKSKKVVKRAAKEQFKTIKATRKRRRRHDSEGAKSSSIRILGTKIPFESSASRGRQEHVAQEQVNGDSPLLEETLSEYDENYDEDVSSSEGEDETSMNTTQQALEYLQLEAKVKLEKIKETIKSTTESLEFDLPKSFHELRRQPIPATFPGRVDHASLTEQYHVFVNPSITEVLCTTTAEALAMGKFVIIPVHPSNNFFLKFPNCLAYRNKYEFVANLKWALAHEPEPLTPELAHEFTWEAATERFIKASAITWQEAQERERLGTTKLDERIAWFHNELGKGVKGDALRKVLGAGPVSDQHKYQIERGRQELLQKQQEEESSSQVMFAQSAGESSRDDDGEKDGEEEDEEEGLPDKFHKSSLAEAIRSTVINGLPSMIS